MVVGCESWAHAIQDITADQPEQGWSHLPGDVVVCNLHAEQLKDRETEWMLVRDEGKLYVGDSLRNLNEYILLGIDEIKGYGSAREFSHTAQDGLHIHMRVRRRGDREKEMVLVIPSNEIAEELKDWAKLLPPFD